MALWDNLGIDSNPALDNVDMIWQPQSIKEKIGKRKTALCETLGYHLGPCPVLCERNLHRKSFTISRSSDFLHQTLQDT